MTTEIRPATRRNADGIRTPEQIKQEDAEHHFINLFRDNVDQALGESSSSEQYSVDSQSLLNYLGERSVAFPIVLKKLRGESAEITITRRDEMMWPHKVGFRRYEKRRIPAYWLLKVSGANPNGQLNYEFGMTDENPYDPSVEERQDEQVLRRGIHTATDLVFAKAVSEYVLEGVHQGILHSHFSSSRHPIGEERS